MQKNSATKQNPSQLYGLTLKITTAAFRGVYFLSVSPTSRAFCWLPVDPHGGGEVFWMIGHQPGSYWLEGPGTGFHSGLDITCFWGFEPCLTLILIFPSDNESNAQL